MLGDVDPEQLGPTHSHEHVLFDPIVDKGEDLRRTDSAEAISELNSFHTAGGSGLVDATVEELGRDPEAVAEVSRATGVHVILATGHTAQEWWDGGLELEARTIEDLAEEMLTDLTAGLSGTGIKAGVIKVGTSLHEVTVAEARIIEAAASAHRATGAPITTHTSGGTMGWEQLQHLLGQDVPADRICIGHLDRRMALADHLALAEAGAYLGYDQISKERHGLDQERAEILAQLVSAGHTSRIMLGSDLARRSDMSSRGGPGLSHVLTRFIPLLAGRGVSAEELRTILVDNPRRFLTWS